MGISAGPSNWWINNITSDTMMSLITSCPAGTVLPDKTEIMCKAGGCAWIAAPLSTQVRSTWNGTTTQLGTKCCVCDWPTLCSIMISCGFDPSDWFVPSVSQLQNPGYVCRTRWNVTYRTTSTGDNYVNQSYWSANDLSPGTGCVVDLNTGGSNFVCKEVSTGPVVRAFRCVRY